jgi:hypothetical protein
MARTEQIEWATATVPQHILDLMPAAALRALARFHRGIASNMETIADIREQEERAAERRRQRRDTLRKAWALIEAMRADGHDLTAAIEQIAMQFGVTVDTVRANYELGAKLAGRMKRARRNREIARLARLGLTNAEIGARLEPPLHPKHVARILRTALAEPEPVTRSGEPPVPRARKVLLSADEAAPAPTLSPQDASPHGPQRDVRIPRPAASILQLADGLQSTHLLAQRPNDLVPA